MNSSGPARAKAEGQTRPRSRSTKAAATGDRNWRSAETRDRLLNAAQALFASENYSRIGVEDIARRAGLSRGAFYLHYSSKDEILIDIARRTAVHLDDFYRGFDAGVRPSRARIREFIVASLEVRQRARRRMVLFYQAASLNTEIYRIFSLNRDRHMAILGEALPAFRDTGRGPEAERRRRAKAKLLFYQFEQIMVLETFIPGSGDPDAEIDALAEAFEAFIAEYDA